MTRASKKNAIRASDWSRRRLDLLVEQARVLRPTLSPRRGAVRWEFSPAPVSATVTRLLTTPKQLVEEVPSISDELDILGEELHAKRLSIAALRAELSAMDSQLEVLERTLAPVQSWSHQWSSTRKVLASALRSESAAKPSRAGVLRDRIAVEGRGHRAVRVEPAQDGVGDAGKLLNLVGSQSVDDVLAGRWRRVRARPRRTLLQPAGVRRALVARASCGQGNRSTRPRSSSRRTTWESRGRVALVCIASAVIRRVRSGASDSIARTKYSKCVSSASRRSWESSDAGQQLQHCGQAHPRRHLRDRRASSCPRRHPLRK